MKLGLKPPVPGAVKLRLASYTNWRQLPTPPDSFGHEDLIGPSNWGVLGNDSVGNCAIAGPCHQIMLWTTEAGSPALFDTATALRNYHDITGFSPTQPDGRPWPLDPGTGEPDNPTDNGTAIADMARYWRNTGLIDATGKRHQIVAYLDLNPGDLRELWLATWLFQSVGMGFEMPESAFDQTNAGAPWDYVPGSPIRGGHYVPAVAKRDGNGVGITWGQPQSFTARFYQAYNNQGVVALSEEMMVEAHSIDGIDDATLRDDLKQLAAT